MYLFKELSCCPSLYTVSGTDQEAVWCITVYKTVCFYTSLFVWIKQARYNVLALEVCWLQLHFYHIDTRVELVFSFKSQQEISFSEMNLCTVD